MFLPSNFYCAFMEDIVHLPHKGRGANDIFADVKQVQSSSVASFNLGCEREHARLDG